MTREDHTPDGDFDPELRELCPDGACIGIIGPDGRCKECGKASRTPLDSARPLPSSGPSGAREASEAAPSKGATSKKPAAIDSAPRRVEGDTFDPELRELCPDGACIGIIGPDGRCKECGKLASDATSAGPPDLGHTDGLGKSDALPGKSHGLPAEEEPAADPRQGLDPDGAGEPDDLEKRALCPDGACIGIIGPDGRCKECGRRAE